MAVYDEVDDDDKNWGHFEEEEIECFNFWKERDERDEREKETVECMLHDDHKEETS